MTDYFSIAGDIISLGKDVIGKPFGFMPFLRFFPPFRKSIQKLREISTNTFANRLENIETHLMKIIPET